MTDFTPTAQLAPADPQDPRGNVDGIDVDAHAAREFVRELTHNPEAELMPGLVGCNFCPIAIASAVFYKADPNKPETWIVGDEIDLDLDAFRADPRSYADGNGGLPGLFDVNGERVLLPGYVDIPGDLDIPGSRTSDEWAEAEHVELDQSGGDCARRMVEVSDDLAPFGIIAEFIRRFDEGEFPALHITTNQEG